MFIVTFQKRTEIDTDRGSAEYLHITWMEGDQWETSSAHHVLKINNPLQEKRKRQWSRSGKASKSLQCLH